MEIIAIVPFIGYSKPGAVHPVSSATIGARYAPVFYRLLAVKSKPPAVRVLVDSEHIYDKRYNCFDIADTVNKAVLSRSKKQELV